jgi:hypothetical protein
LAAGVSACSTDLTIFGGNQPTLTGWIHVEHLTVRAGHLVHADLVLHNSSGHPILLWRGCAFQFVDLVLSHGRATTGPAFPLPLCRPGVTFVAHPGTTIYHLQVGAAYGGCSIGATRPRGIMPRCLAGHAMPPLPAGSYTVTIAALGKHTQHELAHVQSAHVRVLR